MENATDILMYQIEDGQTKIDGGKEYRLQESGTIRRNRIVPMESSREVVQEVVYHNPEIIIVIGYRVRSYRSTDCRKWATKCLNEYLLVKGISHDL